MMHPGTLRLPIVRSYRILVPPALLSTERVAELETKSTS